MGTRDELMTRLKACELEMLKAFIEVCDRLHLKYYLVEGTLLGAVRHQGFIPWDDDIDVGMPRADYERFLNEAQKYLPSHYFVQSVYSELEYHYRFAKIRDSRTTFVESTLKNRKMNHGVYIDVFPIDYVLDDSRRGFLDKIIEIRAKICSMRIWRMFPTTPVKENILKKMMKKIVSIYAVCRYPKVRHAVMMLDKIYAALKPGNLVTNHGSVYGDREVMPVEWYGEGAFLAFEGLSVRVPTEYDKWLSQVYGNYMQFPPPEKRIAHHFTEVIDLDKPYTEYLHK